MTEQNTRVVQDAYAAFGRGDIPGLLGYLGDDVEWHGVIGASPKVPTRGVHRGHGGVTEFFRRVGESVDFTSFEPREFVAQGDKVVALGRYAGKARNTGLPFDSEFVMVFTVRNGKIVEFREYMDADAINTSYGV